MIKVIMFAATILAAAGVAWVAFVPESSTGVNLDSVPTHTVRRGELVVSVTEQGTLESANNTEIKCRVRGSNTITFVIESGTEVQAAKS